MLELARKVIALTGSRSQVVFKPLPSDDPKQRRPDITLARKSLNWAPAVALDDGLLRTIEYFENQLGATRLGKASAEPHVLPPNVLMPSMATR